MNRNNQVLVNFWLDKKPKRDLEKIAASHQRTFSSELRFLVIEHLKASKQLTK